MKHWCIRKSPIGVQLLVQARTDQECEPCVLHAIRIVVRDLDVKTICNIENKGLQWAHETAIFIPIRLL